GREQQKRKGQRARAGKTKDLHCSHLLTRQFRWSVTQGVCVRASEERSGGKPFFVPVIAAYSLMIPKLRPAHRPPEVLRATHL
ncbi:MAG: hypothetical protein ACYSWU_21355, partial [Planctomycetota bacterium]